MVIDFLAGLASTVEDALHPIRIAIEKITHMLTKHIHS